MNTIVIFAACIAVTVADVSLGTRGGYASRVPSPSGSYLPPKFNQAETSADNYVAKEHKHVYVFSAPDSETQQEKRVIRVNGGDKHVNIIFIKSPSESSSSQTEVILPEQDEHKNLVYVLLKKNEADNNVKITRPQPKAPEKPEVHFIRYSSNDAAASPVAQQPEQPPSGLYGTPVQEAAAQAPPPPSKPSGLYGTPSGEVLSPPPLRQSVQSPTRVYGTPADVPPLSPIREPSGLYGTPSQ